jgi:hypothetical protein
MTAPKPPSDEDDPILRNPEAVAEIAMLAFGQGKDRAIEENVRLGVPSYGTDEAQRQARPPKARSPAADLHHK